MTGQRGNSFKPSKALSQNFLTDDNISKKIVRLSGIDKSCGALEVGPGFGALTKHLIKAAAHVTAVETDLRLFESLRETFADCPGLTVIHGDILKTDLKSLVHNTLGDLSLHVCANLPYSITTPVITRLLQAGLFETVTVMVQREVAKRICAAPGSSDYGSFSVFISYHAEPEILFDIPPECFSPRPKVVSSVVKLKAGKERAFDGRILGGDEEKKLFRVVRAAFGQRRKTLVNALHAAFKSTHSKDALAKAVQACGFDEKIRGEALSIEEFVRLSDKL